MFLYYTNILLILGRVLFQISLVYEHNYISRNQAKLSFPCHVTLQFNRLLFIAFNHMKSTFHFVNFIIVFQAEMNTVSTPSCPHTVHPPRQPENVSIYSAGQHQNTPAITQ